jgi:asparagine synthase (glutamine-hydrolysing)
MCGIAGFIGEGNRQILERMSSALIHRGPDEHGLYTDEPNGVHLAHQRLSVIDLSSGQQPMETTDGSHVIVYNGEVYNHAELRQQLQSKGHKFRSDHSDTEVLLHGYREWGEDLPQKLNGMWAFAIWDKKQRKLFCSRDRFGKKPLYYYYNGHSFVFASELHALTSHPIVPNTVSQLALKKYYAYGFIPSPQTIYQNIYKLSPGHNLVLEGGNTRVNEYWRYIAEPRQLGTGDDELHWAEEVREKLTDAVRRRLISDVPLGVFLSGGVDSSAIAAIASTMTTDLKTFSIGFNEASFDESDKARLIADLFKTEHYTEKVDINAAKDRYSQILAGLDEPMGDSSILPTYLLSELTRKKVVVALGGDGADELFAGYAPFKALGPANLYSKLVPKPVHSALRHIAEMLPTFHNYMSLDFKIKRTMRGLSHPKNLWNPIWLGPLDPDEIADLFQTSSDPEEIYSEAIRVWDECEQENLVDKTIAYYTRLYLPDNILVKVDRASMQHSLEARSPFLDIDFVDCVRTIPAEYKYKNGTTKYILKKALEPLLPKSVLYQSKQGFALPIGSWFKSGELPYQPENKFEEDRFSKHQAGSQDSRLFLWNSLLLKERGM